MPKIRKTRLNQKQREMLAQIGASVKVGIVLGLGLLFVFEIILGILGGWVSIFWWLYSSALVCVFMGLSYSHFGKRAFKLSGLIVLVGFLVLFPLFSATLIVTYQSAAQTLTDPEQIEYFRNVLGRSYDYVELYEWENSTLNWNTSSSMTFYSDPIQIYQYGQARCGGFAILYAGLCVSQGYEARIVVSVFNDHVWTEVKVNNVWTRVDPSPTGASISENIGYPLFYEEKWGTPPILALSFSDSSVVDVTSNYRSDNWSLLSWSTVVFFFIGIFFAFCIGLIWKILLRPLRETFLLHAVVTNQKNGSMRFSLDALIRETRFEVENPLIIHGNKFILKRTNGFVTLNDHGDVPANIFRSTTVVLGLSKQYTPEKAHAEWSIILPEDKRRYLHEATLTIRSSRIQSGLHLCGGSLPYPNNPNAVGTNISE